MISLGFAIYSDSTTRECEFRYATYGRLNELWINVRDNDRETAAFEEKIREFMGQSDVTSTSLDQLLKRYLASHGTRIDEAYWNFQLHRFSIDERDFAKLNKDYSAVVEAYEALLEDIEKGAAGESNVSSTLDAATEFWSTMKMIVRRTQEETAATIRKSCQ